MADETVVLQAFQYEFEALVAQDDLEAGEIPSSVLRDTWSPVDSARVPSYGASRRCGARTSVPGGGGARPSGARRRRSRLGRARTIQGRGITNICT